MLTWEGRREVSESFSRAAAARTSWISRGRDEEVGEVRGLEALGKSVRRRDGRTGEEMKEGRKSRRLEG